MTALKALFVAVAWYIVFWVIFPPQDALSLWMPAQFVVGLAMTKPELAFAPLAAVLVAAFTGPFSWPVVILGGLLFVNPPMLLGVLTRQTLLVDPDRQPTLSAESMPMAQGVGNAG